MDELLRKVVWRARATEIAIVGSCVLNAARFVRFGYVAATGSRLESLRMALTVPSQCFAVASMVAFLMWLHAAAAFARAHGNVRSTIPTPARVVAAYFIPILSLFEPYLHMKRIARASDPTDLVLPVEFRAKAGGYRAPALEAVPTRPWTTRPSLLVWWAAFVGHVILAGLGKYYSFGSATAHDIEMFAAAGLWFWVVRAITANQRERARRLEVLAMEGGVLDDEDEDD